MGPPPPFDWDLPPHWSLAKAPTKTPKAKKPPLTRLDSARLGTDALPDHPGHYGREFGPQEHVPPGPAEHREINESFYQPASTYKIEDHPSYPGRYAGEHKPGLKPQPYPTTSRAQERAATNSQGSQTQKREAPAQEKEPSCCVIL